MPAADALEQVRSECPEQGGQDGDTSPLDVDDDAANGRTCPSIETIMWVASQLRKKSPDLASVPSETALALLEWTRSSPVCRAEFWKNLWSRTLPTRGEIEQGGRYADDGSKQIELAERIKARLEEHRVNDEVARELNRKQYER